MDHPHQAHAEDYQPSPSGVLDDIMCGLVFNPADHTFVDLGAGKGRVLFLAAAYPFRRIIGVELVPSLVDACRENIRTFEAPWIQTSALDVEHADAATYRLPDDPLVVYLYNPFRPPVLRRVQRNLRLSYLRIPRSIWLLYYMPVHRQHFDRDPMFTPTDEHRDWVVYRVDSGHQT